MPAFGQDTLKTRRTLTVDGKTYSYYSLEAAEAAGIKGIGRLPMSLKVLLENLLRWEDGRTVTVDDVKAMSAWVQDKKSTREIAYRPARVLMQDFTGVPAVVDLAAMRDAMVAMGGDPRKINPLSPVDLVIDHSVMVDHFGGADSFKKNVEVEYERNGERYAFLRWGQAAFSNFRVVPPGTGICHQVNLEYLAQTVWTQDGDGTTYAYPDTLVGTDSHTTMVNGMAVLGWGVGGIEAEAAMLGQPVSMLIPEVIGFKLTGKLKEGMTATDLVLTVTQMLRKKGVVNKFVEFYGPGLDALSLADRATIANMAPEYGATCGFFPIDAETIAFLNFTGRDASRVKLVEAYAKAQGMWRDKGAPDPVFTDTLELDMASVEPSLAGPKRPQDKIALSAAKAGFEKALPELVGPKNAKDGVPVSASGGYTLKNGDVVIAAITSCTNTSNPAVLIAAGLVARNAAAKGLKVKPWVKTSFAPGSQVVTDYMIAAGLQQHLDALGFQLTGYGCTTCIGNSGPLPDAGRRGDRQGRPHGHGGALGQPQLRRPRAPAGEGQLPRLAAAGGRLCAGGLDVARHHDRAPRHGQGRPVYLKDVWPTNQEITDTIRNTLTPEMFRKRYADVFKGDARCGRKWAAASGMTYKWEDGSTYVKLAPYFEGMPKEAGGFSDIKDARPLALLGDSITTDHISPAGNIKKDGPAGKLPDRTPGAPGRFQFLRRAPRESRNHDARHLRQYPPEERGGDGHHRRHGQADARRRGHVDLRRGDEVQGRAAPRWSSSPARNTAPARRATGRPRARCCWA
jgi:aconitate hydratase